MRLANRSYTQVKVEISEGLGGGSRHSLTVHTHEVKVKINEGLGGGSRQPSWTTVALIIPVERVD